MGVWGPGVFENDWTADFAVEFDKTQPGDRVGLLRRVLDETLAADADDLEEYAGGAIGAAAIVAVTRPGGPPFAAADGLVVPADLVELALRAFDRVVTEEPEYTE